MLLISAETKGVGKGGARRGLGVQNRHGGGEAMFPLWGGGGDCFPSYSHTCCMYEYHVCICIPRSSPTNIVILLEQLMYDFSLLRVSKSIANTSFWVLCKLKMQLSNIMWTTIIIIL